ncbi:hypothetical protein ACFVT5_22470 [Streptomyces sp. NPDC058001]|uniref:hypothetical protein n=1 Tax=Streptomyces sp. NPDC058001 TaxID=3346300 RepID=UPI0036F03DA7
MGRYDASVTDGISDRFEREAQRRAEERMPGVPLRDPVRRMYARALEWSRAHR